MNVLLEFINKVKTVFNDGTLSIRDTKFYKNKNVLIFLAAVFGALFFIISFCEGYIILCLFVLMPILGFIIYCYEWHDDGQKKSAEIVGLSMVVFLSSVTLYYLWMEKHTHNDYKKWDYFNYFNDVYVKWYDDLPPRFAKAHAEKDWKSITWKNLTNEEKAWIRRYFDLYSQEYYFYLNKMIPSDMWTDLIHGRECEGAALINFCEFPILLDGYYEWKKKGAFKHPKDFQKIFEAKLRKCGFPKSPKCDVSN